MCYHIGTILRHKITIRSQHWPISQISITFNLCFYLQPLEKQKCLPVLLITPIFKQKGRLVIITVIISSSGGKENPPFGLGKTVIITHLSFFITCLLCECVFLLARQRSKTLVMKRTTRVLVGALSK